MNIAIVTDSTSDLPRSIQEREGIYSVPADLTLEGQTYQDGFDLSRDEFYDQLPRLTRLPTTSAPSSGRFQILYQQLFIAGYQSIISLHTASSLSGIYNSARLAAAEFDRPIAVIDSQQLTMGLGFQVLEAARKAREGADLNGVIQAVDQLRQRVRVFALLDTFDYIRRSGRISWTKARLGSILRVKPLLELSAGQVISRGLSRTRKAGLQALAGALKSLGQIQKLAVLHTNPESAGREFIRNHAPSGVEDPLLVYVTTLIGTHVGPNALGFAAVVK